MRDLMMEQNYSHSSDQNEINRRSFLKLATGLLSFVVGLILAIPLVGTLIGTAYQKVKSNFSKVHKIDNLPVGQPLELTFTTELSDAYLHEMALRKVWVIKHSSSEVTVFSPICPHLGCHYDWIPESQHFVCPCHGSVYSIDGKVLAGPAPRPLDTLPEKIENGELFVEWQIYEVGIPQKKIA
jgi:menaquinol-cytochrome c reductase iron-sulfur subunit